ncbi:MAG: hypothetical protein FWE31_01160 [Firmicutes bacterium]|nr:hypothetical protein [Bacillota bacterium]
MRKIRGLAISFAAALVAIAIIVTSVALSPSYAGDKPHYPPECKEVLDKNY